MRMIALAHAKINWSLNILSRREDGYHEMDMLMQQVDLADEITFESARWLKLTVVGQRLPVGDNNLVIRAANALNALCGTRNGATIRLVKRIPIRAGLGGGSADCACALLCLNQLWNLHVDLDSLMKLGAELGADVPFCMLGGMARAQGIGQRLTQIQDAPRIPLVLTKVGRGLSTGPVFQMHDQIGRASPQIDTMALADALRMGDIPRAELLSGNSLEESAVRLLPGIASAMEQLRRLGASYVRMTGSGSTVFGAFRTCAQALAASDAIPGSIFTWSIPFESGRMA